jgi:hypothetical protein
MCKGEQEAEQAATTAMHEVIEELEAEQALLLERLRVVGERLDAAFRVLRQELCVHPCVRREREYDPHSSFWWYVCGDCGRREREPFGRVLG